MVGNRLESDDALKDATEFDSPALCHFMKKNIKTKMQYWILRLAAIAAYGGKCARCGFKDIRALQFDHVHGGGEAHRKKVSIRMLMYWLKKNNYPDSFQLLCANCNSIKKFEDQKFSIPL